MKIRIRTPGYTVPIIPRKPVPSGMPGEPEPDKEADTREAPSTPKIIRLARPVPEPRADDGAGSDEILPEKKPGFLEKIKTLNPLAAKREKYDPKIHGIMVDLTFTAPAGVEEIEAYPVNPPFAYVRITYNYATHEYLYEVVEPSYTDAENHLL